MTHTLKAVLFDMDDTLLDWSTRTLDWVEHERRHLRHVYEYLVGEGHALGEPELFFESVRHFSRQGWLEAERGLRAPSYAEAMRSALTHIGLLTDGIDIEACMVAYRWGLMSGVQVFPDAPAVLELLTSHGIKIGLVTNASVPMRFRDRELEEVGLLRYFDDCRLAAVDVGYIKPHPLIFERALQCLGVNSGEAVFVGDNPEADIVGAQSVGMRAVLRLLENRPAAVTGTLIEPDGKIKTLYELLPLLDKWYPGWRR